MNPEGVMRFLTLVFCAAALLPAAEIPQGAHVLLRMVNSVSTRTARDGDRIYMRTASPIVVKGQVLVPADSYAEGVVARSLRSGRLKGRAELAIRVENLMLPNGKTIGVAPRLSTVDSEGTGQNVDEKENGIKQAATKGQDAGKIGVRGAEGAGIGAGIGGAVGLATALVTRGPEVDLRPGATDRKSTRLNSSHV